MSVLGKEVYENDKASLQVYDYGGVWLGAGIGGSYYTDEEFEMLWPLVKAYAEEKEL
jgi:hypothetical protein